MEGPGMGMVAGMILTLVVLAGFSGTVRADAGWTYLTARSGPSWRFDASMVYDSRAARVILFGGYAYNENVFNDTWALDPVTQSWSNESPAASPPRGSVVGMAYDSRVSRELVFVDSVLAWSGGSATSVPANETWAYDYANNTWSNLSPSGSPPAASVLGLVYDADADRTLALANETLWSYEYAGNAWSRLGPPLGSSRTLCCNLAYDSAFRRIITFGGWRNPTTWEYDPANNSWANRTSAVQPRVTRGAMVFDEASRETVLYGGELPPFGWPFVTNETWLFDDAEGTWSLLNLTGRPPAGYGQAIAYIPPASRILVFDGNTKGGPTGLWALDYPSLASALPASSPVWYILSPVVFAGALTIAWLFLRRRERRGKGWERE